jgi:hypothetical protein
MYIPINVRSVKVNYDDIYASVENSRKIRVDAREIAANAIEERVEEAKERLIDEVNNHPVTEELRNGETPGSELVGGGATLFAYVGFPEKSNQAGEIIPFLKTTIRVKKDEIRKVQGKLAWAIPVQIPELEDFDTGGIAEIPWLGRSFVSQIEGGIPGMAQFLYFKRPVASSVSKHGLQNKEDVETPLSSVDNVRARYMTPILERFIKDVK